MSQQHDFFDFNHDGKLDALEWSAKMEFYDELSKDNSAKYNRTVRPSRRNRAGSGNPPQRVVTQKEKVEIDPAVWTFLKVMLAAAGVLIRISMPSETGYTQLATRPRAPVASTRHTRQDPRLHSPLL